MTMTVSRRRTSRSSSSTAGGVLLAFLALPFTSVLFGATLAKLWEWFVVDTFGVRALSTAEAIGLSLVVTFVTYQTDARVERDEPFDVAGVVTLILGGVVRALLALGVGAIVKGFV